MCRHKKVIKDFDYISSLRKTLITSRLLTNHKEKKEINDIFEEIELEDLGNYDELVDDLLNATENDFSKNNAINTLHILLRSMRAIMIRSG